MSDHTELAALRTDYDALKNTAAELQQSLDDVGGVVQWLRGAPFERDVCSTQHGRLLAIETRTDGPRSRIKRDHVSADDMPSLGRALRTRADAQQQGEGTGGAR